MKIILQVLVLISRLLGVENTLEGRPRVAGVVSAYDTQ